MTPQEKAKELVTNFYDVPVDDISDYGMEWGMAQNCALIAVDEILKTGLLSKASVKHIAIADVHEEYWQEVKQEIEKL